MEIRYGDLKNLHFVDFWSRSGDVELKIRHIKNVQQLNSLTGIGILGTVSLYNIQPTIESKEDKEFFIV